MSAAPDGALKSELDDVAVDALGFALSSLLRGLAVVMMRRAVLGAL